MAACEQQATRSPGRFGLLGEHLSHSFSPLIHAQLGNYEYVLHEKKPWELEEFLLHSEFDGLNVTIPYKKTVVPFCAELSDFARKTGSVNTITRLPDGTLFGDNTDGYGFICLLKRAGVDPGEGKTVVLGSGGASQAVQEVLREQGSREIAVVSRTGDNNYENIKKHSDAVLIVNTTPVGMYPGNGVSPLADLGLFQNCKAVIDLIYNPSHTELLLMARECGIPAENGLAMLVGQAKKSAEMFIGESIADSLIEKIISKISRTTRNIVLIGMPGCGKTSIGTELAGIMDRPFADTDEQIEMAAGKTVAAIFSEDGENAFRELETKLLTELCKQNGGIVATGGGVVKHPVNKHIMQQNGVIVFLERDISRLETSGRPLSEQAGVDVLAKERLPIYRQWCDVAVQVGGIRQTAEKIYNMVRQE
ncbi:MAG: shikimate kinase [Oscillospiraceae bacterium]|nr:shikimate kinase [Oscillospiraceae bacterium]